jgi:hypothetical protein
MPGRGLIARAAALALCLSALAAGPAAASTFCVPAFSASCPNSGGNAAVADLEEAMAANASDGVPDQIVLGPGEFSEDADFEPGPGSSPESFEAKGSDPLSIFGAGRTATVLTSAGSGNVYVVNLSFNNARTVSLNSLTIRIPASFPDGQGAAAYLFEGDSLRGVDVASRNAGSDGVDAGGAGNLVVGGELRGEAGGLLDDGLRVSTENSSMTVEGTVLKGTAWALSTAAAGASLTARRVTEIGTRNYGAIASRGTLAIENSRLGIADGIALYASAASGDTLLSADHVTAVNAGGAGSPAFEVKKSSSGPGNATIDARNSILRGFGSGYRVEGIAGPGIGLATLAVRYSNFQQTGTSSGVLALGNGNIDADPLLAADYSLAANSPSVDAGDPAGGGLETDFLSEPRPLDGNGDGIARRDQGAYELQPPAAPGGGGESPRPEGGTLGEPPIPPIGSRGGDRKAPQTKLKGPGGQLAAGKAKFSLLSSEAGSRFQCKLDRRKATACRSPQRYANLAPGRHSFKAWAIDAAGNKDATPAKRRFRVPS